MVVIDIIPHRGGSIATDAYGGGGYNIDITQIEHRYNTDIASIKLCTNGVLQFKTCGKHCQIFHTKH